MRRTRLFFAACLLLSAVFNQTVARWNTRGDSTEYPNQKESEL
jgi:hypothetical protein